MTFKQFILEKWLTTIKIGKDQVDIFKNPLQSELDYDRGFSYNIGRHAVRGLMDMRNDDFYVWDAYLANHDWVANRLPAYTKGEFIPFSIMDGQINLATGLEDYGLTKRRTLYQLYLSNNGKLRRYCHWPVTNRISPL